MRPMIAVLAATLLASCSGSRVSQPDQVRRQPGSWTQVHYIMAYDATDVNGAMADVVSAGQAMIGKKDFGGPACLEAATVAKDNLAGRLREAIQIGPEWSVKRSTVVDGKVNFLAAMDDPQMGKGELSITGTISPTTTDLVVTSDARQPAPGKGHVRTVMKQENTRVGDCTSGEATWE
ncbi:hypothetical protein [Novosphingobium sp.]|uniref:hypothetical protein n=1 Tax=Novosphingobium sp. TaxID=1874826 RepID=UPI00286E0B0F|nr:hypothetical protein [Novosphingobium sp.]